MANTSLANPKDFEPIPLLMNTVVTGFPQTATTDFQIECAGKTFHVHSFVLRELSYFRAIFDGPWKESQSRVLTSPFEPYLIEAFLSASYGANSSYICSLIHRYNLEILNKVKDKHNLEILNKVQDKHMFVGMEIFEPVHHRDPTPLEAAVACGNLFMFHQLARVGDYYCDDKLQALTQAKMMDCLHDCWTSSSIVHIAGMILRQSDPIYTDEPMIRAITDGFADRIDIFSKTSEFVDFTNEFPKFALSIFQRVLEQMKTPRSSMYCASRQCRKNVEPIVLDAEIGRCCPSCHEALSEQARLKLTH